MDLDAMESLKFLEQLKKVKQREIYCPMMKARAITTPLMTIDDLALRTSITSPDLYDQELSQLIYNHTRFPETTESISFSQFIDHSSYIDRQVLIWGIFASTYGTLGKLEITCPFCGFKHQDEITAEQILQDDTLTPWEKEVPFTEYILKIPYIVNAENLHRLEFHTSIATIRQHLDILKLIHPDKLKENYQKFGTILSKTEELSSITRTLKMFKTEDDEKPTQWSYTPDVHMIISEYVTLDIADKILDEYNEHFNKYVPKFRKVYVCEKCDNTYNYMADPEVVLFRQFLRGQ